jgi:hypothetical protein
MSLRRLFFSACTAALATSAVAQSWPQPVRVELERLLSECRSAGGQPRVKPGAVSKAALTDSSFADHIVWSGEIDCRGALTAFGGAAGQALVLVPADGRGVRQIPAHSWKLIGDGPMIVEITGGMDCAMGHHDRCTGRLAWTGAAFSPATDNARVQSVNETSGQKSIVGDWAENRDGCASPMAGLVRIGPKSLTTDELSCTFSSVSRSGSTVTWTGSCREGGRSKPVTINATENSGRVTVRFLNGSSWAPLMRCPR